MATKEPDQAFIDSKVFQDVTRMARMATGPQTPPHGIPYVVIPSDAKIESLEKLIYNDHSAAPQRVKQTVTVTDAASFTEYYTLFADENSRVFADQVNSTILAILDYHGSLEGGPRWCQHRLILDLVSSVEWVTWTEASGARKDVGGFAEFIENNIVDILEPSGATMLEMASDFRARIDANFTSAKNLHNGQVQFYWNEQVTATAGANGEIAIPEKFKILIPIYVGFEKMVVEARLRYRVGGGKAAIWYDLVGSSAMERAAFTSVRNEIQTAISHTIINGTPE